MKPFIQNCVFIRFWRQLMLILALLCNLSSSAFAKEDARIWKPVHGVRSVEFSARCMATTQGKTCYWWFRNLSATKVTLTYAIKGDGFTIKPTAVRVKGGVIVRKTEVILHPNYEQPDIEGYSAQYIGAEELGDVLVIAYQSEEMRSPSSAVAVGTDHVLKTVVDSSLSLGASESSSVGSRDEAKDLKDFCRTGHEVLMNSCRCLPGTRLYPDKNARLMICRQKQVSASSTGDLPEFTDTKRSPRTSRDVQYGPPPPPKTPSIASRRRAPPTGVLCDRSMSSCPAE